MMRHNRGISTLSFYTLHIDDEDDDEISIDDLEPLNEYLCENGTIPAISFLFHDSDVDVEDGNTHTVVATYVADANQYRILFDDDSNQAERHNEYQQIVTALRRYKNLDERLVAYFGGPY